MAVRFGPFPSTLIHVCHLQKFKKAAHPLFVSFQQSEQCRHAGRPLYLPIARHRHPSHTRGSPVVWPDVHATGLFGCPFAGTRLVQVLDSGGLLHIPCLSPPHLSFASHQPPSPRQELKFVLVPVSPEAHCTYLVPPWPKLGNQ